MPAAAEAWGLTTATQVIGGTPDSQAAAVGSGAVGYFEPHLCVGTTAWLSCGGTATTFACGGHCWVKCTGAVLRATAETACTGWTGALGEIDDATENGCVNMKIQTATFWIGAIQGAGAATPADKWTWHGDATRPLDSNHYINWAQGKPDDAGGVESGQEQCAGMLPGGGWDDDPCNQVQGFFCRR